jgi:hypothetical protein
VKIQLLVCFLCFSLASCAITAKKYHYKGTKHNNKGVVRVIKSNDIQHVNSGIIYGNIQTTEQLKDLQINMLFANGKLDLESSIRVRTFNNGNFIAENLKPGKYIISSVDTYGNSMKLFVIDDETDFFAITVDQGEAVYAGTYRIKSFLVTGQMVNAKMILYRSPIPSEKKILEHVSIVEKNSIWARKLNVRMNNLI